MAAPHAFITYSIKDAKGKVSITKINFPSTASVVQLSSFAVAGATLINNLITGKVLDAGIGFQVDLSGATIRSTPGSNSDVEEGARFMWRSAVGALTGFRLPTFDEAKMLTGTQTVNTGDSDVSAFVSAVLSGQGGTDNIAPTDDRGEDITALESARESFTSTRN